MGKPPTTDQELSARVAALEQRADATDAAVATLTSGLDTAEADIALLIDLTDALDARVAALEARHDGQAAAGWRASGPRIAASTCPPGPHTAGTRAARRGAA